MNMQNDVLVRARVSDDGRTVILAPGIEIPVPTLDVVTDIPAAPAGRPLGLLMFFETEVDREAFAELFEDDEAIHAREL